MHRLERKNWVISNRIVCQRCDIGFYEKDHLDSGGRFVLDRSVVIKGSVVIVVSLIIGSALLVRVDIYPLPVHFEEVEQGFYCGLTARVNYIIEDNDTWNTLWTDMHNISSQVPELPNVNFTTEVVIAVFLGSFPTGGYIAEITGIMSDEGHISVVVREQHPGENCGVTMAVTQPYHIVKASITSIQSVEFFYNLVIDEC
jgi:hypothetical protein